jgi:hypothetical protein
MSYFTNIKLNTNNNAGDAFGRLRTSTPTTLFDSKQVFNDPDLADSVENFPLFYDNVELSGSGTSTAFDINGAKTVLSVSATTAGHRVRQTKMRFNYQPGKSQLVLKTFVFSSANVAGITRREGIHFENNGLFFDDNGINYGFVNRSFVTGSIVDTRIAQTDWNIDPMDGTGPSGIDLDFTKTQILVIDFEWLGVGRVRIGWNVNGVTYVSHEFLNANNLADVYMSTPNLPLRSEIINDGTGPAASMTCICASVISEGGLEDTGVVRYASTEGTHVDCPTENTIYAILGIRLMTSHIGTTVKILNFALQEQTASQQLEWILFLNPTVADTFTYVGEAQSAIEVARGATANTITNGYKLAGGFLNSSAAAGGGAGGTGGDLDNALLLGSLIDGTRDEIVLAVRPIGGSTNCDVEGSLTWRELL